MTLIVVALVWKADFVKLFILRCGFAIRYQDLAGNCCDLGRIAALHFWKLFFHRSCTPRFSTHRQYYLNVF